MGLRLGPGPVFVYEWLTAARRWQPYALRSLFVGLILIGMMIVQSDRPGRARGPSVSLHDLAVIGEQTYRSCVMIELTQILLAAPAVTARPSPKTTASPFPRRHRFPAGPRRCRAEATGAVL